jgi:hypothetical protein
MAKFELKNTARLLRNKGIAISKIAMKLGVSKSTVSHWCEDIVLGKEQLSKLYKRNLKGAYANRKKKQQFIDFYKLKGKEIIGELSERDLLVACISLYWAEGSKKCKFKITNSDPRMILFMFECFKRIFYVRKEEFMPRLSINIIHAYRIQDVLQFWSNLLELPIEQFGNPVLIKTKQNKVYNNHGTYFGVLHLGVRKGTLLKYRMLGLIEALKMSV